MGINLKKFIDNIDGKVLTPSINVEMVTISDGYVSDLLSDVMANAKNKEVWITIMKHLNSVAVASLTGIPCIVFANNITPDKEVIQKASEEDVILISSRLTSFEVAGKLYVLLNK